MRDGLLRRLTAQPLRDGRGERCPAFQLSLDDRHIVAGFQLSGGVAPKALLPVGVDAERRYTVTDLATGAPAELTGAELLTGGVPVSDAGGTVSSWMILIDRAD